MSALTAPRDTQAKGVDKVIFNQLDGKQLTNTKIYNGAIVVKDPTTGYCEPGVTGLGLIVMGIADLDPALPVSDSTGIASGTLTPRIAQGVAHVNNSTSGDLITQADVYKPCYLVDDNTVAKTNGAGTRSVAGLIMEVDATGVWVSFGSQIPLTPEQIAVGSEPALAAGAGALPLARNILATVTGTTAYTLANGTYVGQRVGVTASSASSGTPNATITPTTARGFTSVSALGATGDFAEFIWTATGWMLGATQGVTIS
ncbi:MAG TPA: hypothetical protein VHG72_21895 [Polyangia bacterium]|nr:hypothetical protein [Polyangia bacterium]